MITKNKNFKMEPIVRYILSVLLRGEEWADKIAYAEKPDEKALVTIKASDFFDDAVYLARASMPQFPLAEWYGTPILFGVPKEEIIQGKLFIHADIIASSFFLMSRYEELILPENHDEHGRFTGQGSLPGKAGILERPIVDEYGKHLRKILLSIGIKIKEPEVRGMVYLTHDVDVPWKRWNFFSAVRNCIGYTRREKRIILWPLRNFFGDYTQNPFDTFDWIFQMDNIAKKALDPFCEDIYFIIGTSVSDKWTENYIKDKKAVLLIKRLKAQASHIGLHLSYDTGKTSDKRRMQQEKKQLEALLGKSVTKNRNHYLLSLGLTGFRNLISIGITDDYTMGYADLVGFRLGTAQCIRWIDPERMELTNLKLHPLIVMEGTLSGPQYMNLGKEKCIEKIRELYKTCQSVKGDFSMLLHNSILFSREYGWLKDVYWELIQMLEKVED